MEQKKTIRLSLMDDWMFCLGEAKRWIRVDHQMCYDTTKAGMEVGDMSVFLNENPWRKIQLPHDWNTEQASNPEFYPSNGFKPRGVAWYYKTFKMPEYAQDACVLLEFEGIMGESVIYVNGILAARSETGYTGFTTDISDYLLSGKDNIIVVSVDTKRWEGWWYEGAGIYRPVQIYIKPPIHFAHMGIFARTEKIDGIWQLHLTSKIENTSEANGNFSLKAHLLDSDGQIVSEMTGDGFVPIFGQTDLCVDVKIEAPALWSPDIPNLYTLETELFVGGICIETESIKIGFRDIRWTDHGMFINDVLTPVRGICCHQDHAGVGIAVNHSIQRYRIAKLKAMGCNAYRCAHHCPSKYLLEVCDEMGMLVMAENRHYRSSDEVMFQLDALTLLSRNHPSVFLYSLFNEEPMQTEIRGRRMAAKMLRRVRMNDDTRPVTAAMNGGVLTKENASDVLDVAGMNYYIDDYMKYAERRPGHPMVGTENGPLYATRGIYQDDSKAQVYNSYGLTIAPFGQNLQETIEAVASAPHVAGQFVWGGFDYRGEPQPFEWPSVFSHWGLTDNCGFEKDTFYMLKSYYSDADDLMVHCLPHWNWTPGESVKVCVMTNCDTAQLKLNGKLLEEKQVIHNRAEWMIPFEAGYLEAICKKGDRILKDTVSTAGKVQKLFVEDAAPEKDYDCSIINVCLQDENGTPVLQRDSDRTIRLIVHKGHLIGAGNGNPNGIQPDVTCTLETFCGRCQFLVKPDANGEVNAVVMSEDIESMVIIR